MAIRLRRFFNACLDLLFPTPDRCLLCGRVLRDGQTICQACQVEMSHSVGLLCERCGRPLAGTEVDQLSSAGGCVFCAGKPWVFTAARSLGPYEGTLRLAIHRLKFRGQQQLGRALGELLYRAIGRDWWAACDALIPVPLHPDRLLQRGFNQAEVVADQLSLLIGRPVQRVLQRTVATNPQVGLSQSQRQRNVRNAFAVVPGQQRRVRGRRLLLVDDVLTTGSTVDACARVLYQYGAVEVRVATLAVTNLSVKE